MLMDDDAFARAVDEVVALYQAVCDHHQANPREYEILSGMFGTMLGVALDHFVHDIDAVEVDAVRMMFRRTVLSEERLAELAQAGISPYNRPVTREELLQETPGMIPLLLARAVFCWKFHSMPIHARLMGPSWPILVKHYACKLPNF